MDEEDEACSDADEQKAELAVVTEAARAIHQLFHDECLSR